MRIFRRIFRDDKGAGLVEFALIAPVLVFTLLGMFEVGYNLYVQSQLQGAVQKAARSSTIEAASTSETQIDAAVKTAVQRIVNNATVSFSRQSYSGFFDVAQPEDYDDINEDDVCNDGEPFEDVNGNGIWDADRGRDGFGGARDVVLYEVDVRYKRAFGVSQLLGFSDHVDFKATTVLRNQPFDDQDTTVTLENCP